MVGQGLKLLGTVFGLSVISMTSFYLGKESAIYHINAIKEDTLKKIKEDTLKK